MRGLRGQNLRTEICFHGAGVPEDAVGHGLRTGQDSRQLVLRAAVDACVTSRIASMIAITTTSKSATFGTEPCTHVICISSLLGAEMESTCTLQHVIDTT